MSTIGERLLIALAETVRQAGAVPAGHLYATALTALPSLSASDFDQLVAGLVRVGLVERTPAHLLRWIGPHKGGGQ